MSEAVYRCPHCGTLVRDVWYPGAERMCFTCDDIMDAIYLVPVNDSGPGPYTVTRSDDGESDEEG